MKKKEKIIGIDFDNTIACYDNAFYKAAIEKKLIPINISRTKQAVRDYLRNNDRENEWTKLQGYIYGSRMDLAFPFDGFNSFVKKKSTNFIINIISHKTLFPFLGPKYNLHEMAQSWLKKKEFFSLIQNIFFEITLNNKLKRIEKEKCDFFIDDLPELLLEKTFPKKTKKILFDHKNIHSNNPIYYRCQSWKEINNYIEKYDRQK